MLPNVPGRTTALTRKQFSDYQGLEYRLQDLKEWDGSGPITVFGNVYFRDSSGRTYCDAYGVTLLDDGSQADVSDKNTADCADPDVK